MESKSGREKKRENEWNKERERISVRARAHTAMTLAYIDSYTCTWAYKAYTHSSGLLKSPVVEGYGGEE